MPSIDPLRDLAFAIAYRMLGTVSEAEDVVQEALLRLHAAEGVENREAFLTTVTTRLAIDVLRSARVRRETYAGAWLPEPLVEDEAVRQVEDEETISLAPGAVLVGDGGGKARALPRPLVGAEPIARALLAFARLAEEWGVTLEPVLVNGQPGVRAIAPDGRLVNVLSLDVADGAVVRIHSMLNPDKLSHLGPLSDVALRPVVR